MNITAKQIHNGREFMPAGTTLSVNDDGTIQAILPSPTDDTVHFEGILAPGFINAHCHLELSHTKGLIPEHTGLIEFLKNISLHRNNFNAEKKLAARNDAYQQLLSNGIVAIGDIANTTDTLDVRALSKMHFHTFIESLGFTEANADRSFNYALGTYSAFAAQQAGNVVLNESITPHAPYSVSSALFKLIDSHKADSLLSIHNQEGTAESDFYMRKVGGVRDLLTALGIDDGLFVPTGKNSLQSYLEWLTYARPYIFVHNTFSERADVKFVKERIEKAFWCLCPNANLYIENRLPDITMLMEEGAAICIGTDSLASNHQLCILSELTTINRHFPGIGWETLLQWATYNGAAALQLTEVVGALKPGMKPGIVQITNINNQEHKPLIKLVHFSPQ